VLVGPGTTDVPQHMLDVYTLLILSSVSYAGGSNGRHTANSGEDECFNIELDDPPDSLGSKGSNHSQTLKQVFELLNSGLPDSGVEALSIVGANISDPSWRQQFLALGMHPLCLLFRETAHCVCMKLEHRNVMPSAASISG
jgi:hypothetical protein